jgi:hypothetical protein
MFKKPGFKFTTNDKLIKDSEYIKVMDIVRKLWDMGVIDRSAGFCFSVSDMIKTLLSQEGIDSIIVECQLTVVQTDPPNLTVLGYDHIINNEREVSTHVVCITKTKIPLIIDLSIGNLYPGHIPYIVEETFDGEEKNVLSKFQIGNTIWTYTVKKDQKFPQFHQQSIIDRIATDRKIKKEINWLKMLVIVAVVISTINAVRGFYDFYQKYVNDSAMIGVSGFHDINERLIELEKIINQKP